MPQPGGGLLAGGDDEVRVRPQGVRPRLCVQPRSGPGQGQVEHDRAVRRQVEPGPQLLARAGQCRVHARQPDGDHGTPQGQGGGQHLAGRRARHRQQRHRAAAPSHRGLSRPADEHARIVQAHPMDGRGGQGRHHGGVAAADRHLGSVPLETAGRACLHPGVPHRAALDDGRAVGHACPVPRHPDLGQVRSERGQAGRHGRHARVRSAPGVDDDDAASRQQVPEPPRNANAHAATDAPRDAGLRRRAAPPAAGAPAQAGMRTRLQEQHGAIGAAELDAVHVGRPHHRGVHEVASTHGHGHGTAVVDANRTGPGDGHALGPPGQPIPLTTGPSTGQHRHRTPRSGLPAHLHAVVAGEGPVVVARAAGDRDAITGHRQTVHVVQVAPLGERDVEEPHRGDVQPLGRGPTAGIGAVLQVGAPPRLPPLLVHDGDVDDGRPLHVAHGRAHAVEIAHEQVVDRHAKGRPHLPGEPEVEAGHVGHQALHQPGRRLIVDLQHRRQVQVEVVAQELHVLLDAQALVTVLGEEAVDAPVDLDPALDVAHLLPTLRDGRLVAQAVDRPPVDDMGDDGQPTGGRHGLEGEQLVLEEQPFGEADSVVLQQGAAVDLVDGDGVVQQVGQVGQAVDDPLALVQLGTPAAGPARADVDALGGAADDVGARALRRLEQVDAGMALVLVVGVAEHHPGRTGQLDPAVPRGAAAAGVPFQSLVSNSRVVRGEGGHDLRGLVGRAVVDDDDLHGTQGLLLDRPDGPRQPRHVVVADDDDAHVRGRHRLRSRARSMRVAARASNPWSRPIRSARASRAARSGNASSRGRPSTSTSSRPSA